MKDPKILRKFKYRETQSISFSNTYRLPCTPHNYECAIAAWLSSTGYKHVAYPFMYKGLFVYSVRYSVDNSSTPRTIFVYTKRL